MCSNMTGLQPNGSCLPCSPTEDVNATGWCADCTVGNMGCASCYFDGEYVGICNTCIVGFALLNNTNETAYPTCADCTNNDTNCLICSFNSMGDGECNFCINGTGLQ
jgi:hypothetical protein